MAKKLAPWIAALFWIVPILNLVLFYGWNSGIRQKWKLQISPLLRAFGVIIPVVNVVMFYFLLSDIKNHAKDVPEPWLALLLLIPLINIIIALALAYKIQYTLNRLNVKTFAI